MPTTPSRANRWNPLHALTLAGLLMSLPAFGADAPATSQPVPSLQQAAGPNLLIGAAVAPGDLTDPKLAGLIASQFGCLTAENDMKPASVQPRKGEFTFTNADRIADFAAKHHLQLIGHTLCWHQQTPKWMFADDAGKPLPREQALANLRDHIRAVMAHFKGKVKGWDVVNEALNDGPGDDLRDSPARRAIGDDFVIKAFEFAHEADPDVELNYNDYNIESGPKHDRAVRLIRSIKAAGVRIDGVGVQGHWGLKSPSAAVIERGVRSFAAEGVNVMVTELDVDPLPRGRAGGADLNAAEKNGSDPYKAGLPDDVQNELARRYGAIVSTLLRCPKLTRITLWGVFDGHSWLNNFPVRGRTNHPLLWDRQLSPKPARDAFVAALLAGEKATDGATNVSP